MSTQDIKNSRQPSKTEKILAKLPAREISWVRSVSMSGEIFYTTSNPERTQYFLYKKIENGFQRIAKDATLVNFNSMIDPVEEQKPKKAKRVKKT